MITSQTKKINKVTSTTLIIGIDIAKEVQWAQFTDFRGMEISKHLKFQNDMVGFNLLIQRIREIKLEKKFDNVMVGMEPTGHYWKPLASYLEKKNIEVVLINPFHTKRSKELDDNCQTKNDKKDALTIAKLLKDGRYSEMYLPKEVYATLRELTSTRLDKNKTNNSNKNRARAITYQYFPEFEKVFKTYITSKSALAILKACPFPEDILKLGEEGVEKVLKRAVKKTVGKKKVLQLIEAAKISVGMTDGIEGARIKLKIILEEFELNQKHLTEIEKLMEQALEETGFKEKLLSIPGIGIVSSASFLGEIGDPTRFTNPQQIIRLAGYNLVENSSGKHKSKTIISKRGRKNLRSILYNMALVMVAKNKEMKKLYGYFKERDKNPLKGKQAIVVISEKIIKIMFGLMKHNEIYDAEKVFGRDRSKQLSA